MKKSIFTRYISAFLFIIFVSFTVLAVLITTATVSVANEQRKTVALHTGTYIRDYLIAETKEAFPRIPEFEKYVRLNATDLFTISKILLRDSGHTILIITSCDGQMLLTTEKFNYDRISNDEVLSAISSNVTGSGPKELYGSMGGVLNEDYGILVTPVIHDNGIHVGAVIVCYSTDDIDDISENTIRTIILASLWVMIVSFIAIYLLSERIVSPIKQMSTATKRFAAGNFDEKIPVEGSDEIAELATAFNSMAESLAELEHMRSSFLANVAHDLRTPMTSISGFIDGILDGAIPPEKQPYYLEIIGDEIRRLSRLVSNLLDLSRMEAGNRKYERVPFDICETARIILLTFEAKINAKNLDVRFDAPDERLYVFSDKDAIHQVLYNLCENAVKFSCDGGKYDISIKDLGKNVSVTVRNEGIGISAEDLPHVFDRFYKSDKSRGLDRSGVGLGLFIVKTICDNLGESISVDSVQNSFCSFTLTLTKYKGKKPDASDPSGRKS